MNIMHERAKYTRSSHPETRGLQLYLKRDSSTGVFLWILGNFLYREHIWRLLLNMLLASFEYLTSKTTTPANIYLFKVSNRNIRKRFEMCLKLAIKKPEWQQWRCFGVFIVSFEHIPHPFLCSHGCLWTSNC